VPLMFRFMWQQDTHAVAVFVARCLQFLSLDA